MHTHHHGTHLHPGERSRSVSFAPETATPGGGLRRFGARCLEVLALALLGSACGVCLARDIPAGPLKWGLQTLQDPAHRVGQPGALARGEGPGEVAIRVNLPNPPPPPPPAGLVINAVFDISITSHPDAATIKNTIQSAITVYEAAFSNPIMVSIKFQGTNTGLGMSSTFYNSVSYSAYLDALTMNATTADDRTALATLPVGANNPVNGDTSLNVATANLRALGLPGGDTPLDSTISINLAICNLDRTSVDPAKYDLKAVVMHEIDEALGLGSALDNLKNGDPAPTGPVEPMDLFRYDASGTRSFDTAAASQAIFSIDSRFALARFNQTEGGDFGDWFSVVPQVQDAFSSPGATPDMGVELTRLDVIGYSLAALPNITIPGGVTFVGTCVGTTNYSTFYVCNTGNADLQVGLITSSNPQFEVVAPSSGFPVTIRPDFCFPFRVRFTPGGPGEHSTVFSIPSNDPTSPTIPASGTGTGEQPMMSVLIADAGDFGKVCLGAFKDLDLTLNNQGGCDLRIDSMTSSSSQFIPAGVMVFPLLVHPGDSLAVPIRFQPASLGPKSGAIVIHSSDPAAPVRVTAVSGTAPSGDIRITGSTGFGDVCAGDVAEKTIRVCNVGLCNLNVLSVGFDPPCPDFLLVNSPFPASVSHDSCLDVVVRFTPTACGMKICNLRVTTDDPDTPVINLPVTANLVCPDIGVPPGLGFLPGVIQSLGTCTMQQPFPISNLGQCNLIITAVTLGGADAGDFSLSGLPSLPIILPPGHIAGGGDLNVVFAPTVLARARTATITVTYVSDPVSGATMSVTRPLCGEGVYTGARVLVTQSGVPLANVEKIHLQRINANRNRPRLDTQDQILNAPLVTVVPPAPCDAFQYHREYGTVSNPIQLLPGSYQVTVTATVNGKRSTLVVGFDVQTCDFNPTIVVDF